MSIRIIGIDCATQPNKIGIALSKLENDHLIIQHVQRGNENASTIPEIAGLLGKWMADSKPTLLALDAPLGWPVGIRRALRHHQAGHPVRVERCQMFHRVTDQFVEQKIGKRPLEVGADRIARTAHVALELLGCVRENTNKMIPLKWDSAPLTDVQAIEVYPAVTLLSLGIEAKKYKSTKKDEIPCARKSIIKKLKHHIEFNQATEALMEKNDDLIDAVLCVLAGADFLNGKCYEPPENTKKIVLIEGWIWFRGKKEVEVE